MFWDGARSVYESIQAIVSASSGCRLAMGAFMGPCETVAARDIVTETNNLSA